MSNNSFLKKYTVFVFSFSIAILAITGGSCKKYLEKKPSQNLAVPSTLSDLQQVLDNQRGNSFSTQLTEFAADNFYLSDASWAPLVIDLRKNYTWDSDARITIENGSWINPYIAIYNANFVLDFLPKIGAGNAEQSLYNNIKGTALFHRAFMFYELAQLFCKPYAASALSDMGIVLRLTAENETSIARSSVQQTYDQVLHDLKAAVALLPVTQLYSTRPGKAAVYGALARVYLSMRDYSNAGLYADSALLWNSTLLDYNSLIASGNALPSNPLNNPEILFLSWSSLHGVFNVSNVAIADTLLYQSYDINDLRKSVFFGPAGANRYYWKGSYQTTGGTYYIFNGIATDEMYLVRAECRARDGNVNGAMIDLNTLLRKRWKTGTFTDLTAADAADALNKVLQERRKELAFRGLRWTDLRRLNLEGADITLKRIIYGTTYTLPPNDLRWVLLIPELEIQRSGIPQNPR